MEGMGWKNKSQVNNIQYMWKNKKYHLLKKKISFTSSIKKNQVEIEQFKLFKIHWFDFLMLHAENPDLHLKNCENENLTGFYLLP